MLDNPEPLPLKIVADKVPLVELNVRLLLVLAELVPVRLFENTI